MNETFAIERLVLQVREYASGRATDVARGAETPKLAALLLQKYGAGVIDAVATIFDSPRVADPINRVVDEETALIDPLILPLFSVVLSAGIRQRFYIDSRASVFRIP
ncbi:hypothetical protein [Pollutimonas bauzanensis]|uniref:Uncharacterized protein n=1 Tax=Pollutimonas bauzanensis TaxID=658167 RepID=A0A1M5YIY1_9BURK|nr:hypothetical protein [Pollutimonas bauzanensis]SHI11849.1 hypothetical protein SAMN04488135_109128 [Pollutimonas bauzanensis]